MLLPQIAVFTAMLWAALAAANANVVERRHVRRQLKWLQRLCAEKLQSVERHIRDQPSFHTVVTFDGSLTGCGATIQFGVQSLHDIAQTPILTYFSLRWTVADLALVKLKQGDPAGQARLEALALLTALNTWAKLIADARGKLVVRGDALGVLFDVLRFRARDAVLKDLAGEMALVAAPWGVDLRAVHIWSHMNEVRDSLSRLAADEQPQIHQLCAVKPSRPVRIEPTLLGRRAHDF